MDKDDHTERDDICDKKSVKRDLSVTHPTLICVGELERVYGKKYQDPSEYGNCLDRCSDPLDCAPSQYCDPN